MSSRIASVEDSTSPAISPTSRITFGNLLQQLRRQAGLTQGQLALATGYSISLISLLERDKRQPDLRAVSRLFVPALGLQDEPQLAARLMEVATSARSKHPPASSHVLRQLSDALTKQAAIDRAYSAETDVSGLKLPAQPTVLIGREEAIRAISQRLKARMGRLLTLLGPPGVGKTQLALAVASQMQEEYEDGAHFVPLASLHEPELVASAIATALKIFQSGHDQRPFQRWLIEYLSSKEMMLLLDNFEQIIAAAPFVAELVAECPRLCILVTSRERLRVRAEECFYTPPLDLASAIALFEERARIVDPDFAVTTERVAVIGEVCRRLDGLPLAIELIAAHIRLFSPEALLVRLQDHCLDLAAHGARDLPARQQTLRNAIHHSYSLLDQEERRLFRRLGIFVGGCDLQAIQMVCGDRPATNPSSQGQSTRSLDLSTDASELIAGMASLIDKSLVHTEKPRTDGGQAEASFMLLETIRDFAIEEVRAQGEEAMLREQHAAYYLAIAENDHNVQGAAQSTWLDRLEYEQGNLRAALNWCIERQPDTALHLATALAPYWATRGHYKEGRRWLAQVLAKNQPLTPARAKALMAAGTLAQEQSDWKAAAQLLEEGLAIFRSLEDEIGVAKSLCARGWVAYDMRASTRAIELFSESLNLFRTIKDDFSVAYLLATLASVMIEQTESVSYFQIDSWLQESLTIFQSLNHAQEIANVFNIQGMLKSRFGSYAAAASLHNKALALLRALGAKREVANTLLALTEVARYQGNLSTGRRYHDEAQNLFQALDVRQGTMESHYCLGQLERCAGNLDAASHAYGLGLQMALEVEDHLLIARCLVGLAIVALTSLQFNWAAQLLSVAHCQIGSFPLFWAQTDRTEYMQMVTAVRSHLDEDNFRRAWNQGKAMSPIQIVERIKDSN